MSVHSDYLETAFAAIQARYGSIERYLRDVFAVDATRREQLEARLLA